MFAIVEINNMFHNAVAICLLEAVLHVRFSFTEIASPSFSQLRNFGCIRDPAAGAQHDRNGTSVANMVAELKRTTLE